MLNFEIINNINEIPANNKEWETVNFKNEIVNDHGQSIAANYAGHRYQLIKQQRNFSKWERLTRALLAIWMVICSFGKEWGSKKVKNLFTKDHENRRFGIFINPLHKQPPLDLEEFDNEMINEAALADNQHRTITDFTLVHPKEINYKVLSYLSEIDLANCLRVNKEWGVLASHEPLWTSLLPKIAFGKKKWATYFGEIGQEPPLPKGIHKLLKTPCPFWPKHTIEDTHMLVLIPESVDGKPLTLESLGELVMNPKKGHATKYRKIMDAVMDIWDMIINEHGKKATAKSHWTLMTKDVIPGTRKTRYIAQQTLISDVAKKTGMDYKVPTVLDTVSCIFMHHVESGEKLSDDNSNIYTYCQEHTRGKPLRVGLFISGHFITNGLFLWPIYYPEEIYSNGMAAMRKF